VSLDLRIGCESLSDKSCVLIELNCRVFFYSHSCLFQILVTRRMIGSGSLGDGLYYLDSKSETQGQLT
jgi:hypothetical protein